MAATVIDALRRFLPARTRDRPALCEAQRRAVWAITHCRTAEMGGHLHRCEKCGKREFHFHSCNHRACPQCGKQDTARWVERELGKRVGAPYFMVTFTLPEQLRPLFLGPAAKEMITLFFAAASSALRQTLANPRWLGAGTCGFTMLLHTWNQRLHFHPHIHCIVPGVGLAPGGAVIGVRNAAFLLPQRVLRGAFRTHFRQRLTTLAKDRHLPPLDPTLWRKPWGVHLQPFGTGERAIQYLGAYVCRTAIGDARMIAITDTHVSFRWKDRAHGNAQRVETITGGEFVERYLRHVLPRGLRSIRHYGFCHPASKAIRERIALYTGRPLLIGAWETPSRPPPSPRPCPCCGHPMKAIIRLLPAWSPSRAPPPAIRKCA